MNLRKELPRMYDMLHDFQTYHKVKDAWLQG
jgi:hypothetical protein